jgi:hypothetical protein
MIISELIIELERLKLIHGDLPVVTKEYGFGGHAITTISKVESTSVYLGGMVELALSDDDIKEVVPDYDGDEDSLDIEIDCIQICSGISIYAN